MLTEGQRNSVWEKMIAAEVRSMYFGELASCHTKRKQIISGLLFFFSSGAAASLAAKMYWLPLIFAVAAAVLGAYSIAPRWSLQNRPCVDVSKPAMESGLRQVLFYPAEVGLARRIAVTC